MGCMVNVSKHVSRYPPECFAVTASSTTVSEDTFMGSMRLFLGRVWQAQAFTLSHAVSRDTRWWKNV